LPNLGFMIKTFDLIEDRDGKLFGYEFKFSPKKLNAPKAWSEAYPESEFQVISKNNFWDFLI
jgi:uncharacterized protein